MSERVEVFRGASAFLNGAAPGGSGLGGSVNIVPKRAGDDPLNRVTLGYESQGHWYGAADVSRRFGDDSQSTGIRANFVQRGGETSIDNQDRELSVAAIGIDHDSDNFRLSLDLGYQDHQVDSPRPAVTLAVQFQKRLTATPILPKSGLTLTSVNFSVRFVENTILPTISLHGRRMVSDRVKKIMSLLTLDRQKQMATFQLTVLITFEMMKFAQVKWA